jgi:predicted DNA-binding transcriptional regulator AlpA
MTILLHAWPAAMTAEVAAAYCSVDRRRLPEPSFRIGRSARWLRTDLDRWLASMAPGAQEEANPWLVA